MLNPFKFHLLENDVVRIYIRNIINDQENVVHCTIHLVVFYISDKKENLDQRKCHIAFGEIYIAIYYDLLVSITS